MTSPATISVACRKLVSEDAPLPQSCHFCGEPVLVYGLGSEQGCVHHLDFNRSNNERSNLAIAHNACHLSYHSKAHKRTEEANRKRSATMTGVEHTKERRHNIGLASKRTWQRAEKVVCESCGREIAHTWLKRHKSKHHQGDNNNMAAATKTNGTVDIVTDLSAKKPVTGNAWVERFDNGILEVIVLNHSEKSPGRDNTIKSALRAIAKVASPAQLRSAGLQRIERPTK